MTTTMLRGPNPWLFAAERGSVLGMRFVVWCYRFFGRRLCECIVLPVVLYFLLTDRAGRKASRQYLNRLYASPGGREALGHRPTLWDCFLHYWEFALNILDRVGFWLGRIDDFTIAFRDHAHFVRLVEEKRGGIILGSHIGSFDALRVLADQGNIVVNVVMFTAHARMINSVFRWLNPAMDVRIIQLDPGSIKSVFTIKACIDRGEFVALLADRVGIGDAKRIGRVEFLGDPTSLPHGPFLLASLLKCPVIFMVALRVADRAYEAFAECVADRVLISRVEDLDALLSEYAKRLEKYCVRAPYQWFNFYDYWSDEATGSLSETDVR
jgi:predicted LPLAT superfamily acyltransferase